MPGVSFNTPFLCWSNFSSPPIISVPLLLPVSPFTVEFSFPLSFPCTLTLTIAISIAIYISYSLPSPIFVAPAIITSPSILVSPSVFLPSSFDIPPSILVSSPFNISAPAFVSLVTAPPEFFLRFLIVITSAIPASIVVISSPRSLFSHLFAAIAITTRIARVSGVVLAVLPFTFPIGKTVLPPFA
mmetsp:Transcript_30840/g.69536  ORF Transcript_30840/g.69536 Transcript_30840/m.69536 type:complete len:186 (+) Transcript_30840:1379-1936(+)